MKRLDDGSVLSNLRSLQDFVYAENLDIVAVTETWLNVEVLPSGYKIVRKDRPECVMLALREGREYNRITWGVRSDRMEIIAIELESQRRKKSLVCVCHRPLN